jgi:uncharacterized repeat protein (TIGR03803 family)
MCSSDSKPLSLSINMQLRLENWEDKAQFERRKVMKVKLPGIWLAAITLISLAGLAPQAKAQTESLLYNFKGPSLGGSTADGSTPFNSPLVKDASGDLYGVVEMGGAYGAGAVYELVKSPQGYTEKLLYNFTATGGDGRSPGSNLVMDAAGNLFGVTPYGGGPSEYGTVFELVNSGGTYTEKILHSFAGPPDDGFHPASGLVMDSAGNLYGVTPMSNPNSGNLSYGIAYELENSSGNYTYKKLYTFTGANGGSKQPEGGLIVDDAGNLYGTALQGGTGNGTVFELVKSSGGYTEKVLYSFTGTAGDGKLPFTALVKDASGNLYGTTDGGGASGYGTVFQLLKSGDSWSENVLYSFTQPTTQIGLVLHYSGLILDDSGNLFGVTKDGCASLNCTNGGMGYGTVYELIKSAGSYRYQLLYTFRGGPYDGANPTASLIFDASGNLFGSTYSGGSKGLGTVFEVIRESPGAYVLLSPASLDFGDVAIGSTSTADEVIVTNTGTADLTFGVGAVTIVGPNSADFSIGSDSCSGATIAHNNTCAVSVKFAPSTASSESASLNFADNASDSPQRVGLTGLGVGGVVALSPSTGLTFASQIVGTTSSPQTIVLSNNGNAALHITAISITGINGGDFSQTSTCGSSLPATYSCAINVTFTPVISGSRAASLTIADDALGSPHSVPLSGIGAAATAPALTLSPTFLVFASQTVGSTSAVKTITLTNSGNAQLSISGISITGANNTDFSQTNDCGSAVAPSLSCAITVTFTPTAVGARAANVSIAANVIGSPHGVPLGGTGVAETTPGIALSPASLTFSSQTIGSRSDAQTVTLTNSGNADLIISGVSIAGTHSGDYSQTNTCGSLVAAGNSCIISVTFTPTAEGTRIGSVSIANNASGSPHSVSLTGAAIAAAQSDFSVGASPSSISMAAGSSGTTTLTVTPSNGFNSTVAFACSGLPSLSWCDFSPGTVTPNGANAVTTLSIRTTATTTSRVRDPGAPGSNGLRTMLALAGLFVGLLSLRRMRRRGLRLVSLMAFAVLMGIAGCGGHTTHSTNPGTPAGTYTVTVNASSGSGSLALTHTTTLKLTVQ